MRPNPELVRAQQEIRRWKNTCLNIMDRYSDVCEAANIQGHAFFEEDMDDVHETVVNRVRNLVRRTGASVLMLPPPKEPKVSR